MTTLATLCTYGKTRFEIFSNESIFYDEFSPKLSLNSSKHEYSITYVLIFKNRKWKTRLCEFKNKTYNCCLHFKFICSISSRVKANNLSSINQLFVHLSKSSNGQINQSGSLLVLVKDSHY